MKEQFLFFLQDVNRILGRKKSRIITVWVTRQFWGVFLYRTERSLFLLLGPYYQFLRLFLSPLFALIQVYSNIDINYKAKIKGGISVLHPACGIVISGLSDIGENLTLTGGNIIGGKAGCKPGEIIIGNNCYLGANAVIIGPIKLGNNIIIGASACAVKNCEVENAVLMGVPATISNTKG